MPLYEYVCNDCATRFDALVSRERADELICHTCSGKNTRRLVSSFARLGRGFDDHAELLQPATGGGCCGGNCGCGHA